MSKREPSNRTGVADTGRRSLHQANSLLPNPETSRRGVTSIRNSARFPFYFPLSRY